MEKYIPYIKLSKRKKRANNARCRNGWGSLNPDTRRSENPKAYNRSREKKAFGKTE